MYLIIIIIIIIINVTKWHPLKRRGAGSDTSHQVGSAAKHQPPNDSNGYTVRQNAPKFKLMHNKKVHIKKLGSVNPLTPCFHGLQLHQ